MCSLIVMSDLLPPAGLDNSSKTPLLGSGWLFESDSESGRLRGLRISTYAGHLEYACV